MSSTISRIKEVLGLSFQLAKADFKLKNEGTWLGVFWYLLSPILTFGLLFFIFSNRLGNNIPSYSLYLLIGIIIFNLFQSTTIESVNAITHSNYLIKSINFPKESLILSILLKNLFSHFFEIFLFAVILAFSNTGFIQILYYIPVLALFSIFILGFSLFLSSLNVYFADLEAIWTFASRIIWLGTPIFYEIGGQTKLFYLNLFNPLYYFITFARNSIIYGKTPGIYIVFGALTSALISLLAGLFIFGKLKKKFAEMI